ncbi:MAG: 4Fe-4S binding protein [Pseudomonadota bacterium]
MNARHQIQHQLQTQRLVRFTIDGRPFEVAEGTYVLEAAKRVGIEIPTLCEHPDLEPIGACRLCMVEVTHPDWGGWSGLMTACLYPVTSGLQIATESPRVLQSRRQTLSLLAARCPGSAVIKQLAARYHAKTDCLRVEPEPGESRPRAESDNCILCALCTRICETYATGAITTCNRGISKAIGTFAGAQPTECVGCGACAAVCPTQTIAARRAATGYEIWGRSFPAKVCTVQSSKCTGCGACEEACPFSVPRVVVRITDQRVATIPAESCRGCGACVGACPGGAIEQCENTWHTIVGQLPLRD